MEQYTALADLYDGFMDDVDYGTWSRYIALVLERGGFPRTASILECGCGTGNITIPLKKAGFNITGTDVSEAMLTVAAEKARKSGLFFCGVPFFSHRVWHVILTRITEECVRCRQRRAPCGT